MIHSRQDMRMCVKKLQLDAIGAERESRKRLRENSKREEEEEVEKRNTNLLKSTKSGRQRSLAGMEMLVKLLKSFGSHISCSSIQS